MIIKFRVNWGYQYLYSRRHYHPVYVWDGNLKCSDGEIVKISLLNYKSVFPVGICGPALCPEVSKLKEPKWTCSTHRDIKGIQVEADVSQDNIFTLTTVSGKFVFSTSEILSKKYLHFMVGPKYQGCCVNVVLDDYLWFRKENPNQTVYKSNDLNLPLHDWCRAKLAWLKPNESVSWEYEVPKKDCDFMQTVLRIEALCAPIETDKEVWIDGEIPMQLYCDGKLIKEFSHKYRYHGYYRQLLEDVWQRFSIPQGKHVFTLKNLNTEQKCLAISRIIISQSKRNHGQLSVPDWAILDEKLTGKVFSIKKDKITLNIDNEKRILDCEFGWNEFTFSSSVAKTIKISTATDTAHTEIYNCREEERPIKVGFDMTTVVHDQTGEMDWILDYTSRTRLANYVVFRNFTDGVTPELLTKWGEFCRSRGIYVSASAYDCFLSGDLSKSAKEYFSDCGRHEFTGAVYARDPEYPYASSDMKEATEKYIDYIRQEVEKTRKNNPIVGFGDASGSVRQTYLAGVDMVRAETMVAHTMTLLSQMRPASEALGSGRWGVHIAISHAFFPYRETHLGQYFLSIMQPYLMGAEIIYEEDSLFTIFGDQRETWDDLLTKGKREMTRKFYKFAKTHARIGKSIRNIGFIEGRYAAPFNGFICDCEQDPHYSVWGLFGNKERTWGHCQPEKCRQLLDVLMPGASTHPLRQDYTKRRFYFSGTPYGDFDCLPIEATADYLKNYKLLLNLGWNTFIEQDYSKLKEFIKNGGVLLTGIPQFSTHVKRDFLSDMKDLALFNDGDLSEFCGIKVKSSGIEYCGEWDSVDRNNIAESDLSAMPNDDKYEDGKALTANVELVSAEVVAWDSKTKQPLLVKNKFGNGFVYTFTLWAYPGHELFQKFTATWIEILAKDTLDDNYVVDDTKEIFYVKRKNGDKTSIFMLNTDWTVKGNVKTAKIITGDKSHVVSVKERTLVRVDVLGKDITTKVYEF